MSDGQRERPRLLAIDDAALIHSLLKTRPPVTLAAKATVKLGVYRQR